MNFKILWLLVVVFALALIAYLVPSGQAPAPLPVTLAPAPVVTDDSVRSDSVVIDAANIKVGDVVGGLTVTRVNIEAIEFSGSKVVSGDASPAGDARAGWRLYVAVDGGLPVDPAVVDPTQKRIALRIYGDGTAMLPIDTQSTDVSVEIENLKISSDPRNPGYTATIKKVIAFTPAPSVNPQAHD